MILYSNSRILKRVREISNKDEFEKDFFYHYLFIISHIRLYKITVRNIKGDYIPVNMKILKKYVSYDYAHKFLNNLVEGGILSCDNYYIQGLKSKGYKINDEYRNERFFVVDCKDKKLANKVNKKRKEDKNKTFREGFGYKYITECMEELKIAEKSCKGYISRYIKDDEKNESYNIMVDIFPDKFAIVDDKGKRLHNNLTNISSKLRKFITYKNKKLVQVDIRNSQPLFLFFVMKNFFVSVEEMDKYKDVVLNKGFYEFFAQKLNYKLTKVNRKDFKTKIFSGVLFDRNRKNYSKYEEVFKKEFPQIFHIIRDMKNHEYQKVAIELQKAESRFIFYCVGKIAKEKNIPLFTIHDSITTTEGNENIVKDIMLEEFYKLYNIFPKLSIEKFA